MSEPLTRSPATDRTDRTDHKAAGEHSLRRPAITVRHHAATLRIDAAHETAGDQPPAIPEASLAIANAAESPRRAQQSDPNGEPTMLPVSYPQHGGRSTAKAGTSRIQLKLSRNLVAILKAFAKAGQRPSRLVETSLWSDPQMRDAALLLGISAPKVRPRRLNRIRPKKR